MKKILIIYFAFCFLRSAPAQVTFQKVYGGVTTEAVYYVQQTLDGGYIVVGSTASFGSGAQDVYLIKTNSSGDTLWTKTFGGTGNDYGSYVQQTSDGGYFVAGYTNSFGAGSIDIYFIKTDANGDTLWTKTYGGTSFEYANSAQQTNDGGYIICGITFGFGGGYDAYLIKTDSNGDIVWTKTFGGSDGDYGYSVKQINDGGYIIAGATNSFPANNANIYLIRTDPNGNSLWTKTIDATNIDAADDVQQANDGGFIITGEIDYFGNGTSRACLIKTDSVGNIIWTKTFGGPVGTSSEKGSSVLQTIHNEYVIAGRTGSFGAGGNDVYLLKTDSSGNIIWSKTYGSFAQDRGKCIKPTSDGGFIIAGETNSFGVGDYDIYLIKTDSSGNSYCNEGNAATNEYTNSLSVAVVTSANFSGGMAVVPLTITGSGAMVTPLCLVTGNNESIFWESNASLSPNPASYEFSIRNSELKIESVEVYDVLGQCVFSQKPAASSQELTIDVSMLTSGIYFVRLRGANEEHIAKFVKE